MKRCGRPRNNSQRGDTYRRPPQGSGSGGGGPPPARVRGMGGAWESGRVCFAPCEPCHVAVVGTLAFGCREFFWWLCLMQGALGLGGGERNAASSLAWRCSEGGVTLSRALYFLPRVSLPSPSLCPTACEWRAPGVWACFLVFPLVSFPFDLCVCMWRPPISILGLARPLPLFACALRLGRPIPFPRSTILPSLPRPRDSPGSWLLAVG
jgi:hypothetical protein